MNKRISNIAILAFLVASLFLVSNVRAETTKNQAIIKPSSLTEQLGAFVIIAGDRSDHELQNVITNGADRVYDDLINYLGFPAERIYFLGPVTGVTHPNVNDTSTLAHIQWVIETWPVGKVSATHGLGLYLFDHGGGDFMCIPGGALLDTQLNGYLNTLQSLSGCSRDIIIYEACHAGSFINTLSKSNRIVVTSTDITHNAAASASWAYFSESFWGSIAAGNTIGDAFRSGALNVMLSGHGTVQYPLVDDNADMVGNGPNWITFPIPFWYTPIPFLPNGGDGFDASNTVIRGWNAPVPAPVPKIGLVQKHKWIVSTIAVPVWAQVNNISVVKHMWAQVIPPYWSPPDPSQPVDNASAMIQDSNINIVELIDATGSGNYSNVVDLIPAIRGDYRVNIIPEGFGGLGDMVPTTITVNDNGLPPADDIPPMVVITNPLASNTLNGTITITAHGDDDQALKSVQIFIDGVKVADQTMPAAYPYPDVTAPFETSKFANGLHQITAVATDYANLNGTQTITVFVQNPTGFDLTIVLSTIAVFVIGFLIGIVVKWASARIKGKPPGPPVRSPTSGDNVAQPPGPPIRPSTLDMKEVRPPGPPTTQIRESPTTQIRESPTRPIKGESLEIKGESKDWYTVKGESRQIKGDSLAIKGESMDEYTVKMQPGQEMKYMKYTGKSTDAAIKPLKPGAKYLNDGTKK